jgi:hypothetical protein
VSFSGTIARAVQPIDITNFVFNTITYSYPRVLPFGSTFASSPDQNFIFYTVPVASGDTIETFGFHSFSGPNASAMITGEIPALIVGGNREVRRQGISATGAGKLIITYSNTGDVNWLPIGPIDLIGSLLNPFTLDIQKINPQLTFTNGISLSALSPLSTPIFRYNDASFIDFAIITSNTDPGALNLVDISTAGVSISLEEIAPITRTHRIRPYRVGQTHIRAKIPETDNFNAQTISSQLFFVDQAKPIINNISFPSLFEFFWNFNYNFVADFDLDFTDEFDPLDLSFGIISVGNITPSINLVGYSTITSTNVTSNAVLGVYYGGSENISAGFITAEFNITPFTGEIFAFVTNNGVTDLSLVDVIEGEFGLTVSSEPIPDVSNIRIYTEPSVDPFYVSLIDSSYGSANWFLNRATTVRRPDNPIKIFVDVSDIRIGGNREKVPVGIWDVLLDTISAENVTLEIERGVREIAIFEEGGIPRDNITSFIGREYLDNNFRIDISYSSTSYDISFAIDVNPSTFISLSGSSPIDISRFAFDIITAGNNTEITFSSLPNPDFFETTKSTFVDISRSNPALIFTPPFDRRTVSIDTSTVITFTTTNTDATWLDISLEAITAPQTVSFEDNIVIGRQVGITDFFITIAQTANFYEISAVAPYDISVNYRFDQKINDFLDISRVMGLTITSGTATDTRIHLAGGAAGLGIRDEGGRNLLLVGESMLNRAKIHEYDVSSASWLTKITTLTGPPGSIRYGTGLASQYNYSRGDISSPDKLRVYVTDPLANSGAGRIFEYRRTWRSDWSGTVVTITPGGGVTSFGKAIDVWDYNNALISATRTGGLNTVFTYRRNPITDVWAPEFNNLSLPDFTAPSTDI